MAPSGVAYDIDWVISNNSNVHVANNRDWFTSFTPFETYCGQIYSDSRLKVTGIGTVELNVKLYKQNRAHRTNSRIITLYNVLYAPGCVCNIFGQPSSSDYGFQLDFSQNGGTVTDKDGNRAGLIEISKLPRLRLHGGRGGWSSLDGNTEYFINARWADTERARWEEYQAGQQSIPVNPDNGDAPYSTDEKAWLKEKYGGEYKFLKHHGLSIYKEDDRIHGLSIYKEDDRIHGRSIARGLMAKDGGGPKVNGSREHTVSIGGGDHEDEDSSEDDTDNFLQELEDDPMSHLADYNFSFAELKWIQKHYQYSSKFMLSYGLKPFDQEDCDEAKAILKAMMETD